MGKLFNLIDFGTEMTLYGDSRNKSKKDAEETVFVVSLTACVGGYINRKQSHKVGSFNESTSSIIGM